MSKTPNFSAPLKPTLEHSCAELKMHINQNFLADLFTAVSKLPETFAQLDFQI